MEKRFKAAMPCSQALKSDLGAIRRVGVDSGGKAASSGRHARHAPTACGRDLLAACGERRSRSIGAGPPPWPSTCRQVGGRHDTGVGARGGWTMALPDELKRCRHERIEEGPDEGPMCDRKAQTKGLFARNYIGDREGVMRGGNDNPGGGNQGWGLSKGCPPSTPAWSFGVFHPHVLRG